MMTTSSTLARVAIVALGLSCAGCSSGGTYGGASPQDARGVSAAPGAPAPAPAPTPSRAYQPPPNYDSGPGGGTGGSGMGGGGGGGSY